MSNSKLTIRHLAFTGANARPAELEFRQGSNLVWGASNTGKSFTLKAIDFMLGGSGPLPNIEERQGYDTIWLGFSFTGHGDFTISRAVAGGSFSLYDGLVKGRPTGASPITLAPKHDRNKENNLSRFLLNKLGFGARLIAADSFGEKESLSFRDLAKVLLVDETAIQAERSPIEGGQRSDIPAERSVFRLLLSGSDDSAIIPVENPKKTKASKATQLALLDEMIAEITSKLQRDHPNVDGYSEQDALLTRSLESIQTEFGRAQTTIRDLLQEKHSLASEIPKAGERLDEVEIHLRRFAQLDRVYASDIERLEALEEAGFLVSLGDPHDCPLCGAGPESQVHPQAAADVGRMRAAAVAEAAKIRVLRADLTRTVDSLEVERARLFAELPKLQRRLSLVEAEIIDLAPEADEHRRQLGEMLVLRDKIRGGLSLAQQRDALLLRRAAVYQIKPVPKEDKPNLTISGTLVHEFCEVVSRVLTEWGFPGQRHVSFDDNVYDLKIDGKLRKDNGKGVRAVTHAAFKVALLIFCHERNLPHPGFVILDTPLLTYRDPFKNSKFGAPEADELALAKTSLKQKFFEHLYSIRELGQFIIFENIDLPENIESLANVEVFSGGPGTRAGFFPVNGILS